jgi:phosphatidylinositol alpha-1,6-mannosyltransferase
MTSRALLLTPSRGRGGGIERYAETLEWAFARQGVECRRIDLHGSGPAAHARLLAQARGHLRAGDGPARLVVAHRALLPAASLLARGRPGCGISLVCHGIDVWVTGARARRLGENYLMRRPRVRVVAVSSYTAGVLSAGRRRATILPPGLSQQWFDTLVGASGAAVTGHPGIRLVTAFRLTDWRKKGLPQLLAAVADLGRPDVQVTVCGSGEPPPGLRRLVGESGCCTLRPGLTDRELAVELAAADLFVLATRTRSGQRPSGEGFGLVLLEAQVAGTPVIAPAFGGSHDAFIDGVTGVSPVDETTESLTKIVAEILKDPVRLARMGVRAGEWARECFAPEAYASRVTARLL